MGTNTYPRFPDRERLEPRRPSVPFCFKAFCHPRALRRRLGVDRPLRRCPSTHSAPAPKGDRARPRRSRFKHHSCFFLPLSSKEAPYLSHFLMKHTMKKHIGFSCDLPRFFLRGLPAYYFSLELARLARFELIKITAFRSRTLAAQGEKIVFGIHLMTLRL